MTTGENTLPNYLTMFCRMTAGTTKRRSVVCVMINAIHCPSKLLQSDLDNSQSSTRPQCAHEWYLQQCTLDKQAGLTGYGTVSWEDVTAAKSLDVTSAKCLDMWRHRKAWPSQNPSDWTQLVYSTQKVKEYWTKFSSRGVRQCFLCAITKGLLSHQWRHHSR